MLGEDNNVLPPAKIRQFQVLVPDTSDMERTLDYPRRAIIGRAQQFRKGNAITLIANAGARGLASIDTQVAKRVDMKEGPYANNHMILLNPDLDTLSIRDQRQKPRVKVDIPVSLIVNVDEPPYSAVLCDFSESSVRLRVRQGPRGMPPLKPNGEVTIVLNLSNAASTYWIKGKVFRCETETCVVQFKQLYKDGEFANFSLMDTLELKTGVLNYEP